MAELAVDPALEDGDCAIRQLHDLLDVGGDHQHSHAFLLELADDAVHVAAGGGVDAAGGFVEDDDLGTGGQGAGDDHLLLVAARQAADEVVQRDDLGAELVGILL